MSATQQAYIKKTINRNMRCIEIDEDRAEAEGIGRLIETWDVLK